MSKTLNLLKNIKRVLKLSFKFAFWPTLFTAIFYIIGSVLPIWQAKIMGDLVNKIVEILGEGQGKEIILGLIILYASLWAFTKIINSFTLYAERVYTSHLEQKAEVMILKKRTEIDLAHYENPEFQNLLNRAFHKGGWPIIDLASLQFDNFGNIAVFILTSYIATTLSPLIYLTIILTSIPLFVVNLKYGNSIWTIHSENSSRQRKYHHIRSHIQGRTGLTQTKLLQASNKLLDIVNNILNQFRKDNLKLEKKNLIFSSLASLISALGVGISFYLIISDVAGGKESVGSMVFLVSVLGQLVGSISSILKDTARQLSYSLYVSDIFEVMDTKPYIQNSENAIKLNLTESPKIEFKNVYFKYDGREDWILEDVNMTINKGEKIALVGKNGAGKTTLVKLLARIYDPTKGEILVNGVNLKEINLEEWNSYLAILLQDYVSYDFTYKDSVAMGRVEKDIDEKKVVFASEMTGANEFVEEWQNKYDQQLGKEFDGGIEPSRGQQQKIALSRVIYRDGFLVILDEPTASIDALSEMTIFEKMEKATKERSLIVITHRFNTTKNFDKIIVLDHGRIIEEGNHKELMNLNGYYKEMFMSQAKHFKEENI